MPLAKISGTGFFVPPKIMTNDDLSQFMDTSNEWIQERTGIKERRFAENGVSTSDIAIPAVEMAMERAGVVKEDIGLIIFATSTPDFLCSGFWMFIGKKNGFSDYWCVRYSSTMFGICIWTFCSSTIY